MATDLPEVTTSVRASGVPAVVHDKAPRRSRLLAAVGALVVVLCLGLVAHPVRVQANSMEPTYHPGDHLLVRSWGAGESLPDRGDVVVVAGPNGVDLVKRVAGIAGDEVGIADGLLVVDGEQVVEPYLDQPSVDSTWFGPVTVPAGHVFVLGDHRADSVDSRRFGPIPLSAVKGTVIARLWPLHPKVSPSPFS